MEVKKQSYAFRIFVISACTAFFFTLAKAIGVAPMMYWNWFWIFIPLLVGPLVILVAIIILLMRMVNSRLTGLPVKPNVFKQVTFYFQKVILGLKFRIKYGSHHYPFFNSLWGFYENDQEFYDEQIQDLTALQLKEFLEFLTIVQRLGQSHKAVKQIKTLLSEAIGPC